MNKRIIAEYTYEAQSSCDPRPASTAPVYQNLDVLPPSIKPIHLLYTFPLIAHRILYLLFHLIPRALTKAYYKHFLFFVFVLLFLFLSSIEFLSCAIRFYFLSINILPFIFIFQLIFFFFPLQDLPQILSLTLLSFLVPLLPKAQRKLEFNHYFISLLILPMLSNE